MIQNRGLISMVYNFASFEEQGRLVEAYLTDVRMLPNSLSPEGEDRSTLYLDGAAGEDLEACGKRSRLTLLMGASAYAISSATRSGCETPTAPTCVSNGAAP